MISWTKKDYPPPMHKAIDGDGREYQVSKPLILWTNNILHPITFGVYEDGRYFPDSGIDLEVTHWAYINKPDGHLYMYEEEEE